MCCSSDVCSHAACTAASAIVGSTMLAALYRSSCSVGLPGRRAVLRQRSVSVVIVRAVQKDDPAHNRPELLPDQSSWAEHLSSQNLQADRYRPPTYDGQDIQASRGKFLGRLAVLILGVSKGVALVIGLETTVRRREQVCLLCRQCCSVRESQARALCNSWKFLPLGCHCGKLSLCLASLCLH